MRKAKGFTLIELMVVIAIIGILAAVLIPNIIGGREAAQSTGDQANMRQHYMWLSNYRDHRYPFPSEGGAKFVLAPWVKDVVEHTSQCRDRYFTRSDLTTSQRSAELAQEDPKTIWRSFEEITPEDTSFWGRASAFYGDMWRGDAVLMAASGYRDGHVNVLLGDGSVQEWSRHGPELSKLWPGDEEQFPIGPGSPHPELAKLTR